MKFSKTLIYLVDFVLGIAELFILFRIILKLFGASTQAPFVNWIYETSKGLIWPFLGMFPAPTLEGGFIIEFSSIFALLVYAIVGYLIIELIEFISFNSSKYRITRTVTTED